MTIANRLLVLLKEKDVSQKRLAEHLGISPSTLNTWLSRGADFPAQYVMPICRVLDVSPDYLLEGEEGEKARTIASGTPLSDDESYLVSVLRSLDREGVLMVLGKAIDESRRLRASDGGSSAQADGA